MDIESLVAGARLKGGCWRTRLDGDAEVFMTAVDGEIAAGIRFSPMSVRDTITMLDGHVPSASTVKHHLQKNCSCWTR